MAKNVTLAEIRTEIQTLGGYAGSPVFTPVVLNRRINRAIAKVYDLVWTSGDDYYTSESDLVSVAGSDSIALPADHLKTISVGRLSGTRYCRLHRMRIMDWSKWIGITGRPSHYRIQRANLRLGPTPDSIYSIKILYLPTAPVLAVDNDAFDSIHYFDELVIAEVLLWCAERDERPLGDAMAMVKDLTKNIRDRAEARDAGEPEYMADLSDDEEDW